MRTVLHLAGAALVCAALLRPAQAVHSPPHPAGSIEVYSGEPERPYPDYAWDEVPPERAAAWRAFLIDVGGPPYGWHVMWDRDTGVPTRIFGAGIPMPGTVSSAEQAERQVRAFLGRHIELLAPGNRAEDFQVVSNHLQDGMRTIGMVQLYDGMRVLGGQVSFRFKNDRLFAIGSEALPFVAAEAPEQSLDRELIRRVAVEWVSAGAKEAWATELEEPLIRPIILRGGVRYETAWRVTVEAREPYGRFHVYINVNQLEPVAREQLLRFGQGTLLYNVPEREPAGTRVELPAREADITVDGIDGTSGTAGEVLWEGTAPAMVNTSVIGPDVRVQSSTGASATTLMSLPPDGTAVWDTRDDENLDAQLSGFIHTRVVKDYARTFAPELQYLERQQVTNVNINDFCNAFSDGTTINFFSGNERCENTARLPDVVYHEFGHTLHDKSIIQGVGAFDGAFSEGLSDYLAATITNDPAMGRGFFRSGEAEFLRHIDPEGEENRWPDNISEIHYTGLIFAGAMWDLRKELIALYGESEGVARADRLFYAAVQRASSIPTTYVEVLAADDDDGDLTNGTPHECLINDTFGRMHGIRPIKTDLVPLGVQSPMLGGYDVALSVSGTADRCAGDEIVAITLYWRLRGEEMARMIELIRGQDGVFRGTIPRQADGAVVQYATVVELADGGEWYFPNNLGDFAYEFYVGELTPIYCTDFESDPFTDGWTTGVSLGSPDDNEWEWGTPRGDNILDPAGAFSGMGALGIDFGASRLNLYNPDTTSYVRTPIIDVGNYSDVRLQYRRWLTVEDALYDHAIIYANGQEVWRNLATEFGSLHHLDDAWAFHDVPLSAQIVRGTVQVSFELATDPGLEFGGWAIDDLCIVANPSAICGDGMLSSREECDSGDGNSDVMADACRTNCRAAVCGDGIVDSAEECDDANDLDMDGCSPACLLPVTPDEEGCGCTVGGRPQHGRGALLGLLVLLGTVLRRRRR